MWTPLLTIALLGSPVPLQPVQQQIRSTAAGAWPDLGTAAATGRSIHHLQLRIANLGQQRDDLRIDFSAPLVVGGIGLATLLVSGLVAASCSGCGLAAGAAFVGSIFLFSAALVALVVAIASYAIHRRDLTHTIETLEGQLKTAEKPAEASERHPRRFAVVRF